MFLFKISLGNLSWQNREKEERLKMKLKTGKIRTATFKIAFYSDEQIIRS